MLLQSKSCIIKGNFRLFTIIIQLKNYKYWRIVKKYMKIKSIKKDLIITDINDFDIKETLECGQCFHFTKIDEYEYGISAFGRLLHIYQDENGIVLFDTTKAEFNNLWKKYFDLDMDYGKIKDYLVRLDDKLTTAIEAMGGVRILNQEFYETLMSFIISQNKQIPHIKQIVAAISKEYGNYLGEIKENEFYTFPDPKTLYENADIEAYKKLKTGFRAPYLLDATQKVYEGLIHEEKLRNISANECIDTLQMIKGVGNKVASCVALFSLGHREAFPVDVWIKRMMEQMYFDGVDTKKEVIEKFAKEKYGEYGGYAQQYIFYYGRENGRK